MATRSKRVKVFRTEIDKTKFINATEAFDLLKKYPIKFVQSVDVSVNLGIDARKSEQMVRGATVLPNGIGKSVRVAVFAQGDLADQALEAGADIVGFDDLADDIKAGNFNFDVVIASPDAMRLVGKLGPVLGPRGLMPNPKVGTVTADIKNAVKRAKKGEARFRTDKAGIIHARIGSLEFSTQMLKENLEALLVDLKKLKPSASKGVYIKKISVSSTMGPGIKIDVSSIAS